MNQTEKQAQEFANQVMSMNRHDRRKYAKINNIPIAIAGISKPYVCPQINKKAA